MRQLLAALVSLALVGCMASQLPSSEHGLFVRSTSAVSRILRVTIGTDRTSFRLARLGSWAVYRGVAVAVIVELLSDTCQVLQTETFDLDGAEVITVSDASIGRDNTASALEQVSRATDPPLQAGGCS